MNKITRNNKGQMLVVEAVISAIMITLAIVFVSQLTPPPLSTTGGRSYAQWRILCDDALRGIQVSHSTDYMLGDSNGDGMIELADTVYLINYLYRTGDPPEPIWVGDINCDGSVDIGDVVYTIAYIFRGGPDPHTPCIHSHSHENLLAAYLAYNWTSIFTQYLNSTFPDTCTYNIYISNGATTITWYDGGAGRGGNIVRAHRVVTIEPAWILSEEEDEDENGYPNGQIIPGYDGSLYTVTLELEYI